MERDGRNVQKRYRIGNAQTIGTRHTQSNYFSAKDQEPALAVLADGTIDHINGRRCAVLAVEAYMQESSRILNNMDDRDALLFFSFVAKKIQKEMRETIYMGKTPYLSMSCLVVSKEKLFYYTVGKNQVILLYNSQLQYLAAGSGCVSFYPGMTAGLLSAGVQEALREREIISCLHKRAHPYEKAQEMIQKVIGKNRKRAGNATVLLVEGSL